MVVLWKFLVFSASVGLSAGKGLKVYNNVTDLQYNLMPNLFQLDNYDRCLVLKSESLYCFATIQLSPLNPNNPSKIWKIIEETIGLERNFRHDRLRHGICIQESCPNISQSLYEIGNGSEGLWRGLSDCYTSKYTDQGLKGEVMKMYCENDEKFYKIDYADIIYAICIIGLVLLVLVSSVYDNLYTSNCENSNKSNVGKVLRCFSLTRNYARLISKTVTEDTKAFGPIQGIRVINIIFVIMTHSMMLHLRNPVYNPKFIEQLTLDPVSVFWSNAGLFCQTFLIISGWLASYYICLAFDKEEITLKDLPFLFLLRLTRLLPVMILIIGFEATWLRHFGQGPLWQHMVDDEFHNCRNNFFWNFLFINNYYNRKNMCLQQTWYIAAEVQSFIIGLFIMYYVLKHPKHAGKVFTSVIALGIAITFFDHFYHKYDIIVRGYPEVLYTTFIEFDVWHDLYSTGHHHFPCYVLGLAGGYYFYKKIRVEKKNYEFNKFISGLLLLSVIVVPISVIHYAYFCSQEGFELNRLVAASYQAISRIGFGFPIATIIFLFSIGKGGKYRKFCEWDAWQVLARLTFSVYMSHVSFQRIRYGSIRSPMYISNYNMFTATLGDVCLSYVAATVICLFVELPAGALQKTFTKSIQFDKQKSI